MQFLLRNVQRAISILPKDLLDLLVFVYDLCLVSSQVADFDSYPEYYNDDSYWQLAQIGIFKKADGIEEYVRFGDQSSDYIIETLLLDQYAKVKTASDPETGECVVNIVVTITYLFDPAVTEQERVHTVPALLKVFFDPGSVFDTSITVSRVSLYYDTAFLEDFFGSLLISDSARNYVCETMRDSCPDTWALNELSSAEECKAKLEALPAAETGGDVSGNTQGCRILHAAFVRQNPKHCGHISFVPQADPEGEIKCQTSLNTNVTDLFDEEDFGFFNERTQDLGFPAGQPYYICDCSEESSFWHSFFVDAWEAVLSVSPLPATWFPLLNVPMCTLCGRDD